MIYQIELDKDQLEKYFIFLDELRISGLINMFESPKVLRDTFNTINKQESYVIFNLWANDNKRHKKIKK